MNWRLRYTSHAFAKIDVVYIRIVLCFSVVMLLTFIGDLNIKVETARFFGNNAEVVISGGMSHYVKLNDILYEGQSQSFIAALLIIAVVIIVFLCFSSWGFWDWWVT